MTFAEFWRSLFGPPAPVSLPPAVPAPVGSPIAASIPPKPLAPAPSPAVAVLPDALWMPGTVPLLAATILNEAEAFRPYPYDDNGELPGGTWTIGFGSIIDKHGNPVTSKTPPITIEEGLALKQRDMAKFARRLADLVNVPLTVNQASALISFIYNLGDGTFSGSTLRKLVNARASNAEIGNQMKLFRNQREAGVLVPKLGLVRRRHAEWAVYCGQSWTVARKYAWSKIVNISDWPPLNV